MSESDNFKSVIGKLKSTRQKLESIGIEPHNINQENIIKLPPEEFKSFVEYEIARSQRYKYPFSIILITIDNLTLDSEFNTIKELNSRIIELSKAIIRDIDVLTIFNKSQIAICLPQTYGSRAKSVALRISKLTKDKLKYPDNDSKPITLSIGVVAYPATSKDYNSLISKCMDHMLIAQKSGGDDIIYL